jgi:ketosteroid isomerase-like protein
MIVTDPAKMSEAFAQALNSRDIDSLLSLYEPDAILRVDASNGDLIGVGAIAKELNKLLQVAGTMKSRNNFCVAHSDVALLRNDWKFVAEDGSVFASGNSAEIVRRQADGRWLYVIDHAVGASLPPVE